MKALVLSLILIVSGRVAWAQDLNCVGRLNDGSGASPQMAPLVKDEASGLSSEIYSAWIGDYHFKAVRPLSYHDTIYVHVDHVLKNLVFTTARMPTVAYDHSLTEIALPNGLKLAVICKLP